MGAELFDVSVELYDALIDWPKRLANEEPFYRALFERVGVRRVLDVACGTGRHAAMFHSWELEVEGADVSPAMIARCRSQFGESESLRWAVRAFDQPHPAPESFDAVLCIGNSLALAADQETAARAIVEMMAALRPGGTCIVQVLNLWHLPDGPCGWQKCKRVTIEKQDHILVKGVHRAGARGFVNLVDLVVSGDRVPPHFDSAPFWGFEESALVQAARRAGASHVQCYGNVQQDAFQREQSTDLILVAEK
jgi:SAM-dependent methyltransferase